MGICRGTLVRLTFISGWSKMVRIWFFWLCAIFIGCSGGTGTVPDLVDGNPSDSTFTTDPGGTLLDLTSTPDEVADLPILEVAEDKGTPVDTENSCEPGTGCFGEACQGNGDCVSGICLMHEGDLICSVSCIEDCPQGWSCRAIDVGGADLSFACVSNMETPDGFVGPRARMAAAVLKAIHARILLP